MQASGERGWQKGKGGSLDLVQVRRTPCLPGLRYAGEGGSSGSWEGAAETVFGGKPRCSDGRWGCWGSPQGTVGKGWWWVRMRGTIGSLTFRAMPDVSPNLLVLRC